jgi:hypothetical protein
MKADWVVLVPALLVASASLAVAQQSASRPPPLPPPPAAVSLPNPLAGLSPEPQDLYRSPDGSDRFQHSAPYPAQPPLLFPGTGFPFPYYMPYVPYDYWHDDYWSYTYSLVPRYRHAAPRHVPLRGGLVLETIPDRAQVYVDGFYVGLAEEFGLRGRALDLPAGPHHLELRAPDYEMLTFSVMIEPNGIVRYRGDMQMLSSAVTPRTVQQQATPRSFYVIPNCYAGDKPPRAALPKGCSLKNLQTRK